MPQIDPQKNISFYYNFTSKFFESDITVHIGNPLYANSNLNPREAERDLTDRARLSVIQMMGISNDEENQRIMESIKSSGLF